MTSLRAFLDSLPDHERLHIEDPLSLDYVPTAMVLELEKRQQFPVLEVAHPEGFDIPVVANLFASRQRLARIAGAESPADFNEAWLRATSNPHTPLIIDGGPVQEVVEAGDEVDVGYLPISHHFAEDAGRYIGSGILVCKDPETGVRNLSYQRLQLKGPDRFGASLHSRGHIWEHLLQAEEQGGGRRRARRSPRRAPGGCSQGSHGSGRVRRGRRPLLLGKPVELVKCKTIDVEVPASAEIVLEGKILANTREDEGPYGEYTGYSTFRSTRNVFIVKAITRRANPIFLDIIPGYSSDHLLLGRAAKEAHVYHRLKEIVPTLKALNYPKSGTHFHAYFSMKKTAEGQARHALMLLFGLDSYVKLAVAVDEDIDVFNEQEVLWAMATRFQADTDMFVVPKVFCNRLDPSAVDGMSAKLGIDATAPSEWDVQRTSLPDGIAEEAVSLLNDLKSTPQSER